MPICITCSTPVKNLYTKYSKADDRSLGKGVRLTQCPNCKRFADKYVEHDYVVLFIDLVLIKPQVYRHLLFNRLWTPTNTLDPSILRLGILLILFDVYITWARIERSNSNLSSASPFFISPSGSNFSTAPIITQYLFFLTLNVVATVVQHGVIRGLARWLLRDGGRGQARGNSEGVGTGNGDGNGSPVAAPAGTGPLHHVRSTSLPSKLGTVTTGSGTVGSSSTSTAAFDESATSKASSTITHLTTQASSRLDSASPPPLPPSLGTRAAPSGQVRPGAQASPSAISTALLVSSCTKLFPILLVIWPTSGDDSSTSSALAPFANRATSYIGWVVLLNNIEALLILLDCGYVIATALAVAGLLSRWIVEGWLLSFVGLMREMEGPVGDVVSVWRWVVGAG